MTRYLIGALILVLAGMIYWLSAGSQSYTLKQQGSADQTVYTWLQSGQNPVALPLSQTQHGVSFFCTNSRDYYGILTHSHTDIQVDLYSAAGESLGGFSETWAYDFPLPQYILTPGAGQLIAVDMTKRIRILDRDGKTEREFFLSDKTPYKNENVLAVRYSPDKSALFYGEMQAPASNMEGYVTTLAKVSLSGEKIWSENYTNWRLNTVCLSGGDNFFIASLYQSIQEQNRHSFKAVILDNSGRQIGDWPIQFSNAVVDDAGAVAALLDRQHAYIVDIRTNTIVAEKNTGDEHRLFQTATFTENGQIILLAGDLIQSQSRWAYQNISLLTTDAAGRDAGRKQIPDILVYDPLLMYDRGQRTLFVGHSAGWNLYEMNL